MRKSVFTSVQAFSMGLLSFVVLLLVSGCASSHKCSMKGCGSKRVAQMESTHPNSPEGIRPALIGSELPQVTLKAASGESVDLRVVVKQSPIVLIFYRGGWCPYCNLQLQGLQKIEARLKKLGYKILAVAPDRPEELGKTGSAKKIGYTLLSDSKAELATAMGVAFGVEPATVEKYKGWNIDLEAASGEKHHLLPVPAVFLVGTDGKVKFQYVNPDYKVRLPEAVILAAAEASFEPLKPGGK